MKSFSLALGLFLAGLAFDALSPDVLGAADRTLFDFTRDSGDGRMQAAEATLSPPAAAGSGWRVTTKPSQKWPGVTLSAPAGGWDLSPFARAVIKARNTGDRPFTLYLRVDNPGADGTKHCLTGSQSIEPGAVGSVRVDLKRTEDDRLGGKLFGMRGYPVKAAGPEALDPAKVTQVVIFLSQPKVEHAFELIALTVGGEYARPTAWTSDAGPFLPFIDAFGQYRHRDWPGKVTSVASLHELRDAEKEALKKGVAEFTKAAEWNQYGGWAAGPQLEATGFFRVQKYEGRWWLVDPEGRLFWSHGIDCVRMLDVTPIDGRDDWFVDPPWKQADFAEFLQAAGHALMGHYAGRSPRCFSFAGANFKRKYGDDWKSVYPAIIHQRLRAWGLNTIANWSDPAIARLRRTPYTDNLGSRGVRNIEGSEGYWGKFPDVFDPAFRESLRQQMAAKRGGSANDPWCLGYFSDNEMSWGDEVSLSLAALSSPADQPAKQAFLRWLREKYGEIGRLNAVWGTGHADWEGLLASTNRPSLAPAGDDLRAFYTVAAETYFRTVREAIKEVAPQQLYLGCRFAWANARAAAAAAKYCDVVSYNLYRRSVADFKAEGAGDVPLIIGEFHFGALDRGMFHTGLVPVANQAARAQAYTDYVQGALRHPQFVGTHWFQYQDQPTTGRVLDEENYQIGFVDIADTPHEETVSASRRVGQAIYPLRAARPAAIR